MLRSSGKKLLLGKQLADSVMWTPARARFEREVMRDVPVAFWPFQDASGDAVDISGNGLTIADAGTPAYRQPGPMPGSFSIQMDGGDSFSRAVVSTIVNDFTLMIWLRIHTLAATNQIPIYNGNIASSGWGWCSTGTAAAIAGLAGGVAFQSAVLLSKRAGLGDPWMLLHLSRDSADSNRWKYYVNGQVLTANAGTSAPNVPAGNITIGSGSFQWWAAYPAVFETCLSSTRIAAHYAASLDTIQAY